MTLEQIINAFINHTSEVKGRYGLSIRGGALYSYCLLYTSPSPRDMRRSRMPSSA